MYSMSILFEKVYQDQIMITLIKCRRQGSELPYNISVANMYQTDWLKIASAPRPENMLVWS